MKNYQVTITETLKMKVDIEANSPREAEEIAQNKWQNSEYILDAECFDGAEFNCVKERKTQSCER